MAKTVIIEYDFTAFDGGDVLYKLMRKYLADMDGIDYTTAAEAKYMFGGNFQGALEGYFAAIETKKTVQKAERELSDLWKQALNDGVPKAATAGFKAFVKTLAAKGIRVVISTRADLETVKDAFADVLSDDVSLYHEDSTVYGTVKWDAWKRCCIEYRVHSNMCYAITGSGFGVRSALLAGMGVVAKITPRLAYQDYSGAEAELNEFSEKSAKGLIKTLGL